MIDCVASPTSTFYRSEIEIHRLHGPDRRADLPGGESVVYGTHGVIAEHYGIDLTQVQPRPSTLDHVVAATGASLVGTLAGMLTTRGIQSDDHAFRATVTGNVVIDNGVLVLDRVDVHYVLEVLFRHRDSAQKVHELHVEHSPVARSLQPAITIATTLELTTREPEAAPIA
jgi:uncharacterized OsmC-like protein